MFGCTIIDLRAREMSKMSNDDNYNNFSLFGLFLVELADQIRKLNTAYENLAKGTDLVQQLSTIYISAHTIRGSANLIKLPELAKLFASLEDKFQYLTEHQQTPTPANLRSLHNCILILEDLSHCEEQKLTDWLAIRMEDIETIIASIKSGKSDSTIDISLPDQEENTLDNAATQGSSELCNVQPTIDDSMLPLYVIESNEQINILKESLSNLGKEPSDSRHLQELTLAAHDLVTASAMVNLCPATELSEVLEECCKKAFDHSFILSTEQLDQLYDCIDFLESMTEIDSTNIQNWYQKNELTLHQSKTILIKLLAKIESTQAEQKQALPTPSTQSTAAATAQASTTITIPQLPARFELVADPSMLELFRVEAETQLQVLSESILDLEQDPSAKDCLEILMRAAHSLKGAAGMVCLDVAVAVAHLMEDCFVAAQENKIVLHGAQTDVMLLGIDTLAQITHAIDADPDPWYQQNKSNIENLLRSLVEIHQGRVASSNPAPAVDANRQNSQAEVPDTKTPSQSTSNTSKQDSSSIRVSASRLNRLMGLSGESLVESRWIRPYADSMLTLKRKQAELVSILDILRDSIEQTNLTSKLHALIKEGQDKATSCRELLTERIGELEEFDRRATNLSNRLNQEVIASRMRPFSDGLHGFKRMIRDVSKNLNKQVNLEIRGVNTQVDREILEKIEAPLSHILRNAVDHGIELPDQRVANGKSPQATISLEANHVSGMLSIMIKDDGRGIDTEKLRKSIVEKQLATEAMVNSMTEEELLEFIFLPNFSTRNQVTELSGRGVGLDVVHTAMQEMRGTVRATTELGKGTCFHLQLPLTLSVVRALLVEIGGEPYAFPLARVERTLKLHQENLEVLEGRQYFTMGNQHIGVVSAHQVLEIEMCEEDQDCLSVIVIGERLNHYGLIVDRFLGERDFVVHVLDPKLGKIKDISAASMMDDGTPVLIVDVDDIIRSVDILIGVGRLSKVSNDSGHQHNKDGKRILVVDDSITVREVERNMLEGKGYTVEIAVDGMDGWNAIRTGQYDLVISDIDMPRMNGFEFVGLIKQDNRLKSTPVMIVSYKDRKEDRAKGMSVGADYYLTKGSFHDETLIEAVVDLIGTA